MLATTLTPTRSPPAVEALDGITVRSVRDRTFLLHAGGKIEVRSRIPVRDRADLSMAYTPGVARVCNAIAKDPGEVHSLTIKKNTVAIVTDGTAVLGLGDIGPEAALPVMEGKALLFKEFAGIDAFPICLRIDRSDDPSGARGADQLVEAVERLSPVFGGINLEDIAAPRCFEVEERLQASLDIPVFHDDQHGTAVVVLAALRNSLKLVDKRMADLKVVIAGVGAAGVAIAKILLQAGVENVIGVDRKGAIYEGRTDLNASKRWFAEHTNPEHRTGAIHEVMPGSDVFVGVSGPGLLLRDDLRVMHADPIVFALANPDPEILPEEAAGDGGRGGHRAQRLPQPDQQRLVLPRHLSGCARRRRRPHHRGDEAGRRRRHRQRRPRRRAVVELRRAQRVQQAGGGAGRLRGGGGGGR